MYTYINYTDIGGPYKGYETYHIAKALKEKGILKKVYVRGIVNAKGIDGYVNATGNFIPKCRTFVEKYINKEYQGRYVSQKKFDRRVAEKIEGNCILGVSGLIECAKKCKETNGKLIVFATSAHPISHQRILEKEIGTKIELTEIEKDICKVYEMADLILARSDFNKNTLIENGINPDKIKLIGNGINLSKFNVEDRQDKTFRVLFLSNAGILKGLQYALKSWSELNLPDSEFVIAGRMLNDVQDIINQYSYLKNVKYVGHINPVEYYQMSDIFLCPSLCEGSPMTVLEAAACGLPSIVFENTGTLIKEGGFIVNNTEEIKEKIILLYKDRNLLKKMGIKARKEAEGYSYEAYVKKIIGYIDDTN